MKDKVNKLFLDEIADYLEKMNADDRADYAMNIIHIAALYGGKNHYESMGMLQCAILDFKRIADEIIEEDMAKKLNRRD